MISKPGRFNFHLKVHNATPKLEVIMRVEGDLFWQLGAF